jgi:hypothetical protein
MEKVSCVNPNLAGGQTIMTVARNSKIMYYLGVKKNVSGFFEE